MLPTRSQFVLCAALSLSLAAGCLPFLPKHDDKIRPPVDTADTKATVPSLVRYLNEQADAMNSIEAKVDADASGDGKAIGLSGTLACEKPRGFRMRASTLGTQACDLGSNSEEFWFWVKDKGLPYQYHCKHAALATGKVGVPFPFQPEMILVALGMASYDTDAAKYEMKDNKAANLLELTMDTKSPDGRPAKRTVLFRRSKVRKAGEPQVVGHVLRDERGAVTCEAKVLKVEGGRDSGAGVPSVVEIKWPEQKASIKLYLSNIRVNGLTKERGADIFTRQPMPGVSSFDLATRRVDTPTGRASR